MRKRCWGDSWGNDETKHEGGGLWGIFEKRMKGHRDGVNTELRLR